MLNDAKTGLWLLKVHPTEGALRKEGGDNAEKKGGERVKQVFQAQDRRGWWV